MSENTSNTGGNGVGNDATTVNPHVQRLVIYLNGDQPFLGNAPPDWINSFRNIFFRPTSTAVKQHNTEDIIKHLKLVSLDDVEDFPTDCSICLSPFTNAEIKDELARINFLQKKRDLQQQDTLPTDPSIPIPTDAFEEKVKYHKLNQDEDDYLQDHELMQIPSCKHIFGKSCITTWLKTNSTCPLCRKNIMGDENTSLTEQDDTIIYPLALSEIFIPSTWIEFVPDLARSPDPEISLPTNSQSMHSVSGPRRGPLVSEIQRRYSSRSQQPQQPQQDSATAQTDITGTNTDTTNADTSDSSQLSSGGPVRSSSRNSNNRSHPYNRF